MKIRFFNKQTSETLQCDNFYFVNRDGDVYEAYGGGPEEDPMLKPTVNIGWEVVKNEVHMCYVAVHPSQPGAASGSFFDYPDANEEIREITAQIVSKWIERGFTVERVSSDKANEMLKKWKRTENGETK